MFRHLLVSWRDKPGGDGVGMEGRRSGGRRATEWGRKGEREEEGGEVSRRVTTSFVSWKRNREENG